MKAFRNVISKILYSLLSTGLGGPETSRHGCKNVGSDAKHQYKQTKSTQNNKKKTLISIFYFLLQLCASTGTPVYL